MLSVSNPFAIAVVSEQKSRPAQEDAFSASGGVVCILDGHAGRAVADRAAKALPQLLTEATTTDERIKAIVDLDSTMRGLVGGSTMSCAVVAPDGAFEVFNLGDGRVYLLEDATAAHLLTTDDTVFVEEERERIEAVEGFSVSNGRVCDGGRTSLNITRALGDWSFKPLSLPPERAPITAFPRVVCGHLAANQYLLVACDGLFENAKRHDGDAFAQEAFTEARLRDDLLRHLQADDPTKNLEALEAFVREFRTNDNLTVALLWRGEFAPTPILHELKFFTPPDPKTTGAGDVTDAAVQLIADRTGCTVGEAEAIVAAREPRCFAL